MALAIRFDQLLREGVVHNQSELAQLGHVSSARVSQIVNLLYLAPDIQEEILHLPPSQAGVTASLRSTCDPLPRCWTGASSARSGHG